jgi:hypothetical protein
VHRCTGASSLGELGDNAALTVHVKTHSFHLAHGRSDTTTAAPSSSPSRPVRMSAGVAVLQCSADAPLSVQPSASSLSQLQHWKLLMFATAKDAAAFEKAVQGGTTNNLARTVVETLTAPSPFALWQQIAAARQFGQRSSEQGTEHNVNKRCICGELGAI